MSESEQMADLIDFIIAVAPALKTMRIVFRALDSPEFRALARDNGVTNEFLEALLK